MTPQQSKGGNPQSGKSKIDSQNQNSESIIKHRIIRETMDSGKEWEDRLEEWIKTQHGSAGWEQKLENFISGLLQESREEFVKEVGGKMKKLKPKGFGFDVASMNMGYMMALADVKHLLKEKYETST